LLPSSGSCAALGFGVAAAAFAAAALAAAAFAAATYAAAVCVELTPDVVMGFLLL
jgi:hypothetical protein